MKKRNGFTLIEVLAVIVLISVLALVGSVTVTKLIARSKEKAYNEQIKNITLAAKTWATRNASSLAADGNYSVFVDVDDLKMDGLLENKKIIDPRTNEELKGCIQVIYNNENSKYDYKYIVDCNEKSDSEYPTITATGKNYIEVSQEGTPYNPIIEVKATNSSGNIFSVTDPNYVIEGPRITKNGEEISEIIPNKVGDEYLLTYKAIDKIKNLVSYATIKLRVVDTTKPILKIKGTEENKNGENYYEEITINNNYDYPILEAEDNSGENIKVKRSGKVITTKEGEYKIVYTATDSSKNKATYTIYVNVKVPGNLNFKLTASAPDGENNWYKSAATITIRDLKYSSRNLELGTDVNCSYQINSGAINNLTTNTFDVSTNGKNVRVKVICKATINKEEYTEEKNLSLKIDTKAPTCSVTSNYTDWTNQNVILTGRCEDSGSDCVDESITKVILAEANMTKDIKETPGIVKDEAGNTTTCNEISVKIDNQAPTCKVTSSHNDWTNDPVTVTGTCEDSGSRCDITEVSQGYWTTTVLNEEKRPGKHDRTGEEGSYNVRDKAGNVTTCGTVLVQIDRVKPTCIVSGGNDDWEEWKNKNVVIKGLCTDGRGSGCASPNPEYFTNVKDGEILEVDGVGPGPNGTSIYVYDKAGNKTLCPANQNVKIDKAPPRCTTKGTDSITAFDENHLYNGEWTNVLVVAVEIDELSDSGSGYSFGPDVEYWPKFRLGALNFFYSNPAVGPGQNGESVVIYDRAGNQGICPADKAVNVDKIVPKCTYKAVGKYSKKEYSIGLLYDWINEPVDITVGCDDRGSIGSGCKDYSNTITNKTVSNKKGEIIFGTVQDQASNLRVCSKYLKVDTKAPTCEVTKSESGGIVTITGTCKDKSSTLDFNYSGCENETVVKEVPSNYIGEVSPGVVFDKAGNKTKCSAITINKPTNEPICKVTAKLADGSDYLGEWTNQNVTIKRVCEASTSGVGCTESLPDIIIDKNTDNEEYNLGSFKSTNGTIISCGSMAVKIDKDPPKCNLKAEYTNGVAYKSEWTNQNIKIIGNCTDKGGSGCLSYEYSWETDFEDGDQKAGFIGPGDNGEALQIYDRAGNSATCDKSIAVRIDKIPPQCIINSKTADGEKYYGTWTNQNILIEKRCHDDFQNANSCRTKTNVIEIKDQQNGSINLGEVEDHVGNVAECSEVTVRIDKTPPVAKGMVITKACNIEPINKTYILFDTNNFAKFQYNTCVERIKYLPRISTSLDVVDEGGSVLKGYADRYYEYDAMSDSLNLKFQLEDYAGNISPYYTFGTASSEILNCSFDEETNVVTYYNPETNKTTTEDLTGTSCKVEL